MSEEKEKFENSDYRYISDQRAPVRMILQSDKCGFKQKPFNLFAAVFTWYESDIIEATIKNLYMQGVDTVFIIDNCSPDNTMQCAIEGGAVLYDEIYSEKFSDELKAQTITELINNTAKNSLVDRSWWIFCDADEFPSAPGYATIREMIADQDDNVRVIGGTFANHYPLNPPYNVPGFHPADFQFEAIDSDGFAVYCKMAHDKHNIIRFDSDGVDIKIKGSFHRFISNTKLLESDHAVVIQHFNFRAPDHTLPRLAKLALPDENCKSRLGGKEYYDALKKGENPHMSWYIRRYFVAREMYTENRDSVFYKHPVSYKHLLNILNPGCTQTQRWYSENDLFKAVSSNYEIEVYNSWRISYSMVNSDPEEYIHIYNSLSKDAKTFHHVHAIKSYAALQQPEKAFGLLKEIVKTNPSVSMPKLVEIVKNNLGKGNDIVANFSESTYLNN
ncbi:glycosyltransferase family 2 protein [Maridesulfovibrio sp.]|uniref:glycosyltransferase family 2 protein n=1 Tax=Maridesulfovibrio sp. TaxID=2795000 RepID=UPI002A18B014|nr:glycosyltransferase family 2 protein [Maridesulfovibrio sp.]